MDALFRSVHTIKGMAGAMGYAPVEELAHALEDALGRLRDAPTGPEREALTQIATGLDALDDAVEASIVPNDARVGASAAGHTRTATDDARGPRTNPPHRLAPTSRTLRVDVAALDRMLDLAGELANVRERIAQAAARSGDAALARAVAELGRVSGTIADEVRAARLVPIADLLADLPRVVRQAAQATGKHVALDTAGGDAVADRSVLDALAEPLTHLLRNAVDHGIETPNERAAAGKPPEGRVSVRVQRDGNALLVRVEDDGRGVDRAAVVARARARGQLPDGPAHPTPDTVDDATLLDCLALPGLTTAHAVGRVSGRGVGVDAALARVRALGGSLSLRTAAGAGTCFTLRMPLSWAVVPALVVRAGGAAYALPLAHVRGTRDVTPDDRASSSLAGLLAGLLGVPAAPGASGAGDVVLLAPAADAPALAVTVDALVGARECVLKPVATPRGAFRLAAGATILDGGEVALVLDVPALAGRPAPGVPAHTRPPP